MYVRVYRVCIIQATKQTYDPPFFLYHTSRQSVQYARAYYAYALAKPDECLRILAELGPGSTTSSLTVSSLAVPPSVATTTNRSSWSSQMSTVDEEIREGRSWLTIEQIRARCIEGIETFFLH